MTANGLPLLRGRNRVRDKSVWISVTKKNHMAEGDVVIYTHPGCATCQPQKKFLLQKKGDQFTEKRIQEDEQALLKQLLEFGAQRTPIAVIGGEVAIVAPLSLARS